MHFGWLNWLLLSQVVVALSRAKCTRRCPLDDDFHCFEVVYPHALVAQAAVPLGGRDPAMTEEILNRLQPCTSVEHLIRPGVAQRVTGYRQGGLLRVVFNPLLEPTDRKRLTAMDAFLHEKDPLGF